MQVWLSLTEESQRLYSNPHTYVQPSCPQQGEIQMNSNLFPEGWRKDIFFCPEREENFKWVLCRRRGCILTLALLVLFEEPLFQHPWALVWQESPPSQVWKVESRKIWWEGSVMLRDEASNMSSIQKHEQKKSKGRLSVWWAQRELAISWQGFVKNIQT